MRAELSELEQFLEQLPSTNGILQISQARPYQHGEEDYDRQYGTESHTNERLVAEAANLMDFCGRMGLEEQPAVLEIGCGTGRISIGLSQQATIGRLVVTDPSPAFCRIVAKKLAAAPAAATNVSLGLMGAEDVGRLPAGSISLILLRSVLHHISDVDGFLAACAGVLRTGGLLVCEEPYYEGYMMMGFLGQFFEDALRAQGLPCSEEDRARFAGFVETMQFYCRRDLDKSGAEDKHLFRPEELAATGRGLGLEFQHFPNWGATEKYESYTRERKGYFEHFVISYLRYCMDWPQELTEKVHTATRRYFHFFAPLDTPRHSVPHCFGTFVFRKS
jgi:ubiquinone/menaquinone biosynthesis C-methylase UbiE